MMLALPTFLSCFNFSHVKKKANSKPDCLNQQEIPYRLREIMRSRNELKNPTRKKKKAGKKQLYDLIFSICSINQPEILGKCHLDNSPGWYQFEGVCPQGLFLSEGWKTLGLQSCMGSSLSFLVLPPKLSIMALKISGTISQCFGKHLEKKIQKNSRICPNIA